MANMKLGIQTEISGLSEALVENVVDNCMNITYIALMAIPNAR